MVEPASKAGKLVFGQASAQLKRHIRSRNNARNVMTANMDESAIKRKRLQELMKPGSGVNTPAQVNEMIALRLHMEHLTKYA